jgi:glycosyltransferase involved in cell wall biosynthesis
MKVLCIADYFYPGYKAGGVLRSLVNLFESLGAEIEFFLITRDRDMSDSKPYPDIPINCWTVVANANVYYASPNVFCLQGLARLLEETNYDTLYLNSFFSPVSTLLPLFLRYTKRLALPSIVLAPHGELYSGALSNKPIKKLAFIYFCRLVGLYRGIIWHATNLNEARQIKRFINVDSSMIHVVPYFMNSSSLASSADVNLSVRSHLDIVFLSRIVPKKNLHFLLDVLYYVTTKVHLTIYGPIEDSRYWRRCLGKIKHLPSNISVDYQGSIPPDQVHFVFRKHDYFFFPTLGENFGFVIYESLVAGTPVIASNKVPWCSHESGALQVLPLRRRFWVDAIEALSARDERVLLSVRSSAFDYAIRLQSFSDLERSYIKLFSRPLLVSPS